MNVVSGDKAKLIDKYAIETIGIPSIVLMENAGTNISESIKDKGNKYIIFCGTGNNGGYGLVVARKLFLIGKDVKVIIIDINGRRSSDFNINLNIINNLNIDVREINKYSDIDESLIYDIQNSDIVLDAIFGIGLNRKIEGIIYDVIKAINTYSKHIISIDIPSGIQSDLGKVLGIAVKASETYTIENIKIGFLKYSAFEYLGKVSVIDIGIPKFINEKFSDNIFILNKDKYKKLVPIRKVYGHKGDYGNVLFIGGSQGFSGAAYIGVESTVRSGAGLVTLLTDSNTQKILSTKLIEAMTISFDDRERIKKSINKYNVIACGPGLGTDDDKYSVLSDFLKNTKTPMVLDADALNIISEHDELLSFLKYRAVITPHPGEFSRLSGYSIDEIEENRIEIAKEYAIKNKIVVVLKGYNTVITDGNFTVINCTGNSKMASGGMGDCLTGIIASFIGQGLSIFNASILGCYIHGLAGDKASINKYTVSARDIIDILPKIIEEVSTS